MPKSILALAHMEKFLKRNGASRVSQDAKKAMRVVLEKMADELAEKAVKLSKHSGRKTVKADDLSL